MGGHSIDRYRAIRPRARVANSRRVRSFDGRHGQEGVALLFVVIAALLILTAVGLVVGRVYSAQQQVDVAIRSTQLDETCRAGIDIGIERVWNQYITGNGNTTGNLASYIVFVENLVPNNEDTNDNGVQDSDEVDRNGDGNFDMADPVLLIEPQAPRDLPQGGRIVSLSLARTDDITGTTLTFRSTAELAGQTKTASQTVRVAGRLFQGFEYAVLANNINCILCHADIEPLDAFRNNDPSLYGTFDRIKIASLESMMIRTNEDISTRVAGSTYTRGSVYNHAGTLLTAAQIASSTMKARSFSNTNGKLTQNSSGAYTTVNMANAGLDSKGKLQQFKNLYLSYPTDESAMTDGDMPTSFPAPYPDDNGNRNVDDEEFERVVNSADGSLHFTLDPDDVTGTITAGVAYGVPAGTTYTGNSLPTASNTAISHLSSSGAYEGNLILVGSKDDPIVIDKKVAVDGDLVIKGSVKGWGQLLVRGNVYVVGDVTYADATGKFGEATDGTKNGFALTAGGSIMMGDYLTIRSKHHPNDKSKFPSGAYIDVRTQNKTTKVTYNGNSVNLTNGYFDAGVTDAGWSQGSQSEYSFTTSELMLFNRMEKKKASTISDYTPRYYRIRPTQPIYTYTASDEHAVRYDDSGVATITNTTGATIHNLNPSNFWLSENQLRQFWYADEMTRPASGRPLQFDGLLYSNNSIFGITRSSDRHKSNTRGMMTIRGGIVAADLGMLVPGPDFSVPRDALNLYYDRRVSDFLRVEDTTQVSFTRLVYRPESSGD